jgi:hypothetical protein
MMKLYQQLLGMNIYISKLIFHTIIDHLFKFDRDIIVAITWNPSLCSLYSKPTSFIYHHNIFGCSVIKKINQPTNIINLSQLEKNRTTLEMTNGWSKDKSSLNNLTQQKRFPRRRGQSNGSNKHLCHLLFFSISNYWTIIHTISPYLTKALIIEFKSGTRTREYNSLT